MTLHQIFNFSESLKSYIPAFNYAFLSDFSYYSHDLEQFNTLNIATNTAKWIKHIILINFNIQIEFVAFGRGLAGPPIDSAPASLSGIHCSAIHGSTPEPSKLAL